MDTPKDLWQFHGLSVYFLWRLIDIHRKHQLELIWYQIVCMIFVFINKVKKIGTITVWETYEFGVVKEVKGQATWRYIQTVTFCWYWRTAFYSLMHLFLTSNFLEMCPRRFLSVLLTYKFIKYYMIGCNILLYRTHLTI